MSFFPIHDPTCPASSGGICNCHQAVSRSPAGPIPVLNWTETVGNRLEPAINFGRNAKVMSEYSARKMVLEVLAKYGIYPSTEE